MSNYPKSSPAGTHYIPLTVNRLYTSTIDAGYGRLLDLERKAKEKYLPDETVTEAIARRILGCLASSTTLKSFPESTRPRAESRINKILDDCTAKLGVSNNALELYRTVVLHYFSWFNDSCAALSPNPFVTHSRFALTSDDFEVAGADQELYLASKRSPDCSDYAFYCLNETRAFAQIFHVGPDQPLLNLNSVINSWGYLRTQSPVKEDLVVYCSTSNEQILVVHWGIWIDEGRVRSKWGASDDNIYEHAINDVPLIYGDFAFFFHKEIKSPLMGRYIDELDRTQQGIDDFSHHATASPRSLLGCRVYLIQKLESSSFAGILEGSFYNTDYHRELLTKAVVALHNLPADQQSKGELIEDLRQTTINSALRITARGI